MHSIKTRLFLILLSANALLALLTYAVVSWSFDRGFLDYLNRAERERLTPLIQALEDGHREHGDWQWLAENPRQWRQLMHRFLFNRRGRTEREDKSADRRALPPLSFDPRLALLDADKRLIAGRRGRGEPNFKPISQDGQVIGYLAIVPRRELAQSVEQVFAAQQNRNFAIIAAGMVLMSGLLAIGIAAWLTRPIKHLAAGTRQLTRGHFDHRIQVTGRHELAQLAKDFNSLALSLAANQKSRRQWIADIAHELRTPLTVLRGEIEALLDRVRPLSLDSIHSLASEIRQLTRLVDDLYELSLSDLGALEYRKQPLDLSASLDDIFTAHAQALEQAGLALDFNPATEAVVSADPQRLAQLWHNLLQNSLRYTDAPGKLRVEIKATDKAVTVIWQDSAPGVDEADLERLTERLFRVDSARSRAAGGSGLGLAIAAAVVEGHGGTLQAFSAELGGLGWEIVLPR
ncbi:HAMP domain-containing protein [Exilibacterium tricleocarpae]|uniref:histidine kinase n=1 Tax=Exilibacterium tricleocarpae TaxID=2591008 RepID=A0A545T690_9GAMM|nr:ATP-binding protein [Exilibacterium tricleocarpae]TQV72682.1 HAMP domain-containing protein [Exilibacterium tricleocarpae]